MHFNTWIKQINKHVYKKLQMNLDDLPDYDFRIAYDHGISARTVANEIIKDQKDYFNFLTK